MTISVYLDSSTISKRYIIEKGTDTADLIFDECEIENTKIYFSIWNIGEVLGVFDKYHKWQEIIKNHNLIIYPREDNFEKICAFVDKLVAKAGSSEEIIILDPKEFRTKDVSSTEIREKVKNGESISKLVTKEVEGYIKSRKLYLS